MAGYKATSTPPEPISECTIVEYILSNPHRVPLDKVIKIEAEGERQLTYKLTSVVEATLNSATNIFLDRWDLQAWITAVEKFQVTTPPITPPMALALARVSLVDEFNLSSVHLVFIAGASTPPEAITGLKTRLGVDIVIGLGVTETMSTIDCLPGKIYTGYLVKRDSEGFFYFLDRKSDIINVKGHVVAPAELEAVLLPIPSVLDAAVTRTSSSDGDVPRAFVFVDEKMRSRSTAQQILSFVDDKVDQFHRIAGGLSFVDKIPKSPAGKILRRLLPRDSAIVAKEPA